MMDQLLPIEASKAVRSAWAEGRSIVALESTIVAHGLPWPDNLDVGRRLEAAVVRGGAVPATIAVLDGRIKIGLEVPELERIARGEGIRKLSRRDLAVVLARGGSGATTVSATMICAARAGIRIFATGGIGGVHRGAETSFDVSADLEELARTPVAVVSAGAKSILDLPKTLEHLESRGVPVIGWRTDRFPAFHYADSGLTVPDRAETAEEVAGILRAQDTLTPGAGLLLANPIPEADALPRDLVESAIREALAAAEASGVAGRDLTPDILRRLAVLTDGRSVSANLALGENNAVLAAQVAVAYGTRAGETPA